MAAMALVTYIAAYAHWPTLRMQVDLMVYRFAADRLLAGLDLYSTGLTGKPHELLFIYPPFAAICAAPLALLTALPCNGSGCSAWWPRWRMRSCAC